MSSGSSESSGRSEELFLKPEIEQLHPSDGDNAAETSDQPSLVDSLAASVAAPAKLTRDHRLERFLNSDDPQESIELWLGRPLSISKDEKESLARKLNQDVAIIDEQLNRQLNEVIHHPRLQKLEASWRGLKLLQEVLAKESNEHDPYSPTVKVKILDVSWQELEQDFSNAGYVEQSAIFDKVYEQEFGMHGGEPFGLLIGDYEVDHSETRSGTVDDLFVLDNMSAVAASAFSPFVTNASPQMLDMDDFSQLDEISDLSLFDNIKNVRWNRLTAKEDSRFLGLCLPRILMRLPYGDRPEFGLASEFKRSFREKTRLN
ncbi:MAG: type VI secretion system contractile sheath large subunit, partial [Mariniblastus sp.]|nr:type VI secretion system contractile sheath large subunit [Mariniblastus sp.]